MEINLVAGNGGSSADADHFTGELVCTLYRIDQVYQQSLFQTIQLR